MEFGIRGGSLGERGWEVGASKSAHRSQRAGRCQATSKSHRSTRSIHLRRCLAPTWNSEYEGAPSASAVGRWAHPNQLIEANARAGARQRRNRVGVRGRYICGGAWHRHGRKGARRLRVSGVSLRDRADVRQRGQPERSDAEAYLSYAADSNSRSALSLTRRRSATSPGVWRGPRREGTEMAGLPVHSSGERSRRMPYAADANPTSALSSTRRRSATRSLGFREFRCETAQMSVSVASLNGPTLRRTCCTSQEADRERRSRWRAYPRSE